MAICVAQGCKYCEAAHLAFCSLLSVQPEDMAALTENIDALRPGRTKDIIRFSVTCALQPRTLEQSDFAKLRAHGITDGEIAETVAMCGFAMYAVTVADAFRLDVDPEITSILAPHLGAVS